MEQHVIMDNIAAKIRRLDDAEPAIKNRAQKLAQAEADYDRELGKWIQTLEDGGTKNVDGVVIKDSVATVRKTKAQACCAESKKTLVEAQGMYKSAVKYADIICAQLNGFQSMNRVHLKTSFV